MTDQHRRMDSVFTLETILVLKLNKDLLDTRDIERLRRQKADEGATERRGSLPPPMLSTPTSSGGASYTSTSALQGRNWDDNYDIFS